jgi:hypothetical protein
LAKFGKIHFLCLTGQATCLETSFGMGIAVLVGSMTYFSKGDLQLLSVLSACAAAHACFF